MFWKKKVGPTDAELARVVGQLDGVDTDDLSRDLVASARQAMALRGDIDGLRAEIIRKEAVPEDASADKAVLAEKEALLRAIERKLNWLRRELYSRDPRKYSFLRR